MSKSINILLPVIMVLLCMWLGCKQNTSPTQTLPQVEGLYTEEVIWYPQHELFVTYRQDTFRVVAVNLDRRKAIVKRGNRQIVRSLDSLVLVEY